MSFIPDVPRATEPASELSDDDAVYEVDVELIKVSTSSNNSVPPQKFAGKPEKLAFVEPRTLKQANSGPGKDC